MAFTALSGQTLIDWYLQNRPGYHPDALQIGIPGDCLISDLQGESTPGALDGDFLLGARALVLLTGATSGSGATQTRSLTLYRLGLQWTSTWHPSAQVRIIRSR